MNIGNSLIEDISGKDILKPRLHYMIGSNFIVVPHLGVVSGVTLSPSLSIPLSPKLSVEGGITGRFYYSNSNINPEIALNQVFNEVTIYGSAIYHINSQFTVYGTGIKQLAGTSSSYFIPKSSYAIGSTYDFGNFSIGVNLHMSEWNDYLNPFPLNRTHGFNFMKY